MPVIGLLHPKPSPTMTGGRGSLLLIQACLGLHNWRNPESISLCICEVDPIYFESAAGSRRKFPPGQQRVAVPSSAATDGDSVSVVCVQSRCPLPPGTFHPSNYASLRYPSDASLGPGGGKRQAQGMEPIAPSTLDPSLTSCRRSPQRPGAQLRNSVPPPKNFSLRS